MLHKIDNITRTFALFRPFRRFKSEICVILLVKKRRAANAIKDLSHE